MNFQRSHFKLMVYFFIAIIILFALVYYIKGNLEIERLNTIETNLLFVQAKINNIRGSSQINKDDNAFIGKKVTEYSEDSTINALLEKSIISQDECDKYYVLDEKTLNDNGLGDAIVKKNEYILVNYETGEIVLSRPYIYKKHEYYKLSEIKQIER